MRIILNLEAETHGDFVGGIAALARSFGAAPETKEVPGEALSGIDPNTLLEIARERFAALGYDLDVVRKADAPVEGENPPETGTAAPAATPKKRGRKPKAKTTETPKTFEAPKIFETPKAFETPDETPKTPETPDEPQLPFDQEPVAETKPESGEAVAEAGVKSDPSAGEPGPDLQQVKVDGLKRIGVLWADNTSRKAMSEIRDRINERHMTNYESWTKFPAEMFPEIMQEVDAYEQRRTQP